MSLAHSVGGCVRALLLCYIAVIFAGGSPRMATAAEGGTSIYLLGFRGSFSGYVPPPGKYFQSDTVYYQGEAKGSRSASGNVANFDISGVLVSEVEAEILLEILTGTWVANREIFGGHFGLSLTQPFGWAEVTAGAAASISVGGGPIGPGLTIAGGGSATDDLLSYGDPFLTALIGWHAGNFHWNANVGVNIPVGDWKLGRLANLGFNRWALDTGVAVTWLDQTRGLEFTVAPGVTFNVENPDTNYRTGTEFHVEFAAMKNLGKKVAVGVTGYHYQQLTGDSGSGALLGDFKGRVTGIGPKLVVNFNVRGVPVSANARWIHEFNVERRLEGNTGMMTIAIPLGGERQ
jgi:hypothetical protein